MNIFLRWIVNALLIMIVAYLVPGFVVHSFYTALIVALVLGLTNAILRPILIILTLPVTVLTLGLFVFVINALLIMFVSSIVKGFEVNGFLPALIGALLLTVLNGLVNTLRHESKSSPQVRQIPSTPDRK